jgi:hypothetical protein
MTAFREITKRRLSTADRGVQLFLVLMIRVRGGVAMAFVLLSSPSFAQSTLQNLMGSASAAQSGTQNAASLPYNVKLGDFKLLVMPSLELDWNDNINGTSSGAQQDFIIQPSLQLKGTYPVTTYNVLTLSAGIGYAEYLEHPIYNGLRIDAGSQVAFDVFVKDFHINLHDSAQETQDTGSQGAVAGTAFYGGLMNTVGVLGTWNLPGLILGVGFDERNYVASSSLFNYLNYTSENPVARAGFHLSPDLITGVESTASFITYSEDVLNNNQSYSVGVYTDWKPGSYFHVTLHGGYSIYDFDQTSQSTEVFNESPSGGVNGGTTGQGIRTSDLSTWYAGLTISHQITKVIGYSASFDHEVVPGVQSDASEVTSVGPAANWSITKNLNLHSFVNFEHAQQGLGNISGNVNETYNFLNCGLSADYAIVTTLLVSLSYRRAMRYSNLDGGSYAQDLVSLKLTYRPK